MRWLRKFAAREPLHFEKLRLYWRVLPYTMCSYERLNNAFELASIAESERIPGAFVECGVYKGGCAAVLAWVARRSPRRTWLFDSFEGLPEPSPADGAEAAEFARSRAAGRLAPIQRCVGPLADVERILFDTLGLAREKIAIRKGWFQQTLPASRGEIGPIAILRLDGDWYESTRTCLMNLYENVVPGGFVIFDDYGRWEGCRRAVDEFAGERGLGAPLERIDAHGVFLRKP